MTTLRLARAEDAEDILHIYTPFVRDTHVSFEYEVPSLASFGERIHQIMQQYPWIVAEQNGQLLGYAYASTYRSRMAYSWVVESSIYLPPASRGTGLAQRLYHCLLELLRYQGFLKVYAGISLPNEASVAFHRKFGFRHLATFEEIGYKFGQWYAVDFWELDLQTQKKEPKLPVFLPDVDPQDPAWQAIFS